MDGRRDNQQLRCSVWPNIPPTLDVSHDVLYINRYRILKPNPYLSIVSEPNSDDEKLVIEETAGGHESISLAAASRQTPEIERFDRVRAAIHDKRGGGGGGGRPHNAFVGSGGVGMEDHGGGAGDRIRSVCVTARPYMENSARHEHGHQMCACSSVAKLQRLAPDLITHDLLVRKEFIHSALQVLQLVSRGGGQRGQVLHDGAQGRGETAAARRLLLLRALLRPLPPRRLQEEQVSSFINIRTHLL